MLSTFLDLHSPQLKGSRRLRALLSGDSAVAPALCPTSLLADIVTMSEYNRSTLSVRQKKLCGMKC